MNEFSKKILVAALLFLLSPFWVSAATASWRIPEKTIGIGDTIIAEFWIEDNNVPINAIDGRLVFDSIAVSVDDINLAGSIFGLWPQSPVIGKNGISFTGGTPSPIKDSEFLVFKLALTGRTDGKFSLVPSNLNLYLHDGKGTTVAVKPPPLLLAVSGKGDSDALGEVYAKDKTGPSIIFAEYGSDSNLYAGQPFLNLIAADKASGLSYFEVKERGREAQRSFGTYVFTASPAFPIKITAIDRSGNQRVYFYLPVLGLWSIPKIFVAALIIILFGGLIIFRRRRIKLSR